MALTAAARNRNVIEPLMLQKLQTTICKHSVKSVEKSLVSDCPSSFE
jgi:hypothetical protein